MKLILRQNRLALVILIAIILVTINAFPVFANPGLSVSNALILTDVTPGQAFTHTMQVSIASSDPAIDMEVRVFGIAQDLKGTYVLLDAAHDTGPYSARTFVTVDQSSFHLEPGGFQSLTATIQVPQDVGDGGRYAIINVATKASGSSGLGIITAANIPVFLTVKGSQITQTGKISGLSTNEGSGGQPINILTNFQNTGNHHFKVKGQVTIKDARGQAVGDLAIPLTSSSILPGMTRQFQTPLKTTNILQNGTYSMDAKVTMDDGTLLDQSTGTFKITQQSVAPAASIPTSSNTPSNNGIQYVPPAAIGTVNLNPSSASTLQNDDGSIYIIFPQGAAVTPVKVELQNLPADQVPAPPSGTTLGSTYFRVVGLTGLLANDATLTVKYTTADLDKGDGNASTLKLARWNEGTNQWVIYKTSVGTGAKTLTASSNQMGIWAVVIDSAASPAINWTIILITVGVLAVLITVTIVYTLRKRRK
jgi:hypothetical protein